MGCAARNSGCCAYTQHPIEEVGHVVAYVYLAANVLRRTVVAGALEDV